MIHEPSPAGRKGSLEAQLFNLHCAIDIESFWRANRQLLQHALPHHSCSLMLNIMNERPLIARHHVVSDVRGDYKPASSLTVSGDFLNRHRQVKLYTFSQVLTEDPGASQRRLEQEQVVLGNWNEFVHLAFWDGERPDAILSVRRQGDFSADELTLLERLHPIIDSALHRLRALERERGRQQTFEHFVAGLPIPILFLDEELRLTFATAEGYEATAQWNLGDRKARAINPRFSFELPKEIAEACLKIKLAAGGAGRSNAAERVPPAPQVRHGDIVARVAQSQPSNGPWSRPGFLVTFTMERNLDGAPLVGYRASLKYLQLLSPSERRVALLVAEGRRNNEIARHLHKSERTVECQLNTVYRKLNLSNRVQLVRALA